MKRKLLLFFSIVCIVTAFGFSAGQINQIECPCRCNRFINTPCCYNCANGILVKCDCDNGTIDCGLCFGGKARCDNCIKGECGNCEGGKVLCDACKDIPCGDCENGWVDCTKCNDGECNLCEVGIIDCPDCDDGDLVCGKCNGKGIRISCCEGCDCPRQNFPRINPDKYEIYNDSDYRKHMLRPVGNPIKFR